MSWVSKYWDTIDQLYWDPSLLGLASVPKSEWQVEDALISIPKDRVRKGGSIYTRKGSTAENSERLRRLEEPLNHIFDITFGIAPDEAIQKLILHPLGFEDHGPFERLGREITSRYDGFANINTTQQDGFYVGPRSITGVELKLGSKTWPGQALKYLALMVAEEKLSGRRDQIGLLYITPHETSDATFHQLGASNNGKLAPSFLANMPQRQRNKVLSEMLERDQQHFEDALGRLCIKHISWRTLCDACKLLAENQVSETAAGQTYRNLMAGFADAIESHTVCV